ncbi:Nucleic acid-binding, OB-fold-like protein [Metarhizium rileyi]|uniref:rRNA biogenesis protein RRP5 n=1 Tax=Metarhizium rileyi (strain RCEF 4871) TaxID=1649241 RepID=A0A166ZY85_METRR|nr:Nucleic acid-binding, OB-fold-like protein [Metarhizium rileyi RCEF 4871]
MSNLKRKDAPGGQPPAKSAKNTKEGRPSKTAAPAVAKSRTAKAQSTKTTDNDTRPKATVVSLLKNEEPIFPRGGGSVLTPLEQKQIQLEARADARREEEFDTGGAKAQKKSKKRKVSLKSDKKGSEKKDSDDSVKVESLNFKKLVKGSLVLGQITRITPLELEVSLPNNLTGHVSIVAVSEQLTNRIQEAAVEQDDAEDESSDETDVDLKSMFSVGQYLRVYVVSTMNESVIGKNKRKIELSLRPTESNSGLGKDDLVANSTVMASVVSVEDRGCVMDVGIPGLGAFLPNGEIESTIDQSRLQEGSVFLCHVTGKGSNGNVVQLSLLQKKLGSLKDFPADATTINTFLPGTTVNVLITNTDRRGLAGKVIGHLDVTADLVHSGAGPNGTDLEATYKIGSKVKARVICNFPTAKEPKLGISLLPHITSLTRKHPAKDNKTLPTEALPISSLVDKCTVRHVESEIGLFVDIGVPGLGGFVHISRVKDGKVDALYESSGPYQVGSVHKGRVVGYSELDGQFLLSFEKSILDQQYIRVEDVPVGAVITCEIEKLVVKEEGVSGLILKVANGITGYVAERHLSDIKLQHPEKKFREGMKVKARVLSTNPSHKQIRFTLKKTLVNSDAPVIKSYSDAIVGTQAPGTIIKLQANGAHIQFYGNLKGFLPVSEMSEAYIRDPNEHFRIGQVVSVHILDVDPEQRRLIVSCKDPGAFGLDKQTALKKLKLGELVTAKVTQKTEDQIFVELADSQLKAVLPVGHLTDKSNSKNQFALKRISAGQTLSDLMVIDKNEQRRAIILTRKPSLIKASAENKLLSKYEDAKQGVVVPAFVRNITQTAVFVQFAGALHALLPKSRLPADVQSKPDFGMHKYESIEVKIVSIIDDLRRIMVAPTTAVSDDQANKQPKEKKTAPADGLEFGTVATATITSVKETQLNVQLLNTQVQGRVDVSQVFDTWEDISDAKEPLSKFRRKQQIKVKVIGVHDAKDHRFLPLSHRSAHSVLELSAKRSDVKGDIPNTLSLDSLKVGDSHIAYINNVTPQFLWVNLSPNIRGRVSAMEASDDLSLLNDLESNFPVGSALKVRVTSVDTKSNHLDLSARSSTDSQGIDWSSLKQNMVLPGKITKVNERQVMVKLSEIVSGPVHLPDMADNFDDINTLSYKKNQIVRVSIVEIDTSNKRLRLSLRPSRIMSSTLPVVDKEITDPSQVAAGDVVRGFVKNVSDKGLFVVLGGHITALVKIANLSDRFIKNWKDQFQVDQLVKGRVLSVDTALKQIELSLKASVVDEDYTPPITYMDLKEGSVVTGKVRKVEEFGAFILVDNSTNVSGLCHRSQMADEAVKDATKLYKEGDAVKALVLEVDATKRRISFGLKPSLFDEDTDMESEDSNDGGVSLDDEEEISEEQKALLGKLLGNDSSDDDDDDDGNDEEEEGGEDDDDDDEEMEEAPTKKPGGLGVGKKSAWTADPFDESGSDSEEQAQDQSDDDKKTKKKRRKAEIEVDRTAELDAHGPQTSSDYERLLLGQPDSSELWIAYMAFQMQVSELPKAREVAERAIKSINIREETEKLNVWVAYLNLEVAYGTKQTVEDVFKRACQYNDEQEVHERLASIYIQSEKLKDADALFETMLKKFGAKAPSVWTNYAHFLSVTMNQPDRARALLPRATQQLPTHHSQNIVGRFAALEFRSPNGEPERGRTMFEGLLATWPKKGDLWSQLLDLEMGVAGADADATAVRDVFERRTRVKGLKPNQAEKWFRRWAAWEEKLDAKGKERVMAKAQDWAALYKAKKEAEAAEQEDEEMDG